MQVFISHYSSGSKRRMCSVEKQFMSSHKFCDTHFAQAKPFHLSIALPHTPQAVNLKEFLKKKCASLK